MKKLAALMFGATLLLAGCGDSDDDPTPTPSDTRSEQAEKAGDELADQVEKESDELKKLGTIVEITIADGKVAPQGKRVEVQVGKPVTLRITSDTDEEIHVHSDPEHELEVGPGTKDKDLTFTLKTPGQVAVEAHHLDVTIVQLVVTP